MLSQIIFTILFLGAIALFTINVRKIIRNIKLGRSKDRSDQPAERLRTMLFVASYQKEMFNWPIPSVLHLFVYLCFVIINIDMLEIIIDRIASTHRVFSGMGAFYNFHIASFEWLALSVLLGCVIFLIRRNIV